MGAALSASWRVARPFVNATVGDLEWWQVGAHPFDAWEERIRLWELDGEVVAYAWLTPPAEFDWHQRRDLPPSLRARLADEAIAWADGAARAAVAAGTVGAGSVGASGAEAGSAGAGGVEAPALSTYALDADPELGTLLAARGFVPDAAPAYSHWYRRLDDGRPIDVPALPAGYRLRTVRLPDDREARVEVHRSAFAPSRFTTDKHRRLEAMPHYAPERDLVVEAPDGSLAAFTLLWWDPVARIGELEPVGTHREHRRLGLARAVNLAALALLRGMGAVDGLVFSACDNPASEALYASDGFEAVTRHRAWRRPLGPPPGG